MCWVIVQINLEKVGQFCMKAGALSMEDLAVLRIGFC
jgi:hypothetical protein